MIDTLFFALQIVGIVVIVGWALVADRMKNGAGSRGPLAFRTGGAEAAGQPVDRRRRSGLTRF